MGFVQGNFSKPTTITGGGGGGGAEFSSATAKTRTFNRTGAAEIIIPAGAMAIEILDLGIGNPNAKVKMGANPWEDIGPGKKWNYTSLLNHVNNTQLFAPEVKVLPPGVGEEVRISVTFPHNSPVDVFTI